MASPASPLAPVVLEGAVVRLEPLGAEHADALAAAGAIDRSTYTWTRVPDGVDGARAYIEQAVADHAAGISLPFVTRLRADGRVVGSTRFLNVERWGRPGRTTPDAAEIGATWLAADQQRSGANTDAKLLMLSYAFDEWAVDRLQLKTDARNTRSRTAIEGLGAVFEGILRNHMPAYAPEGGLRDSAMYSIVPAEWPAVRDRLRARLVRHGIAPAR